jgi:hypothetical protein
MLFLPLRRELNREQRAKLKELRSVTLEKILSVSIDFSEMRSGSVHSIVVACLDKYLEKFEKTTLLAELNKKQNDLSESEIAKMADLFNLLEYEISAEKSAAINRLHSIFFNKFCNPATGLIDWVKLIQFNSGNYSP